MAHLLLIGLGGFFGAIARYVLSGWAYATFGHGWAWGTLVVNVCGSLFLGMTMTFSQRSLLLSEPLRDAIAIGFLGALTTFSTFSWETVQFLRAGALLQGGLNLVANCALCLVAVAAGIATLTRLS